MIGEDAAAAPASPELPSVLIVAGVSVCVEVGEAAAAAVGVGGVDVSLFFRFHQRRRGMDASSDERRASRSRWKSLLLSSSSRRDIGFKATPGMDVEMDKCNGQRYDDDVN